MTSSSTDQFCSRLLTEFQTRWTDRARQLQDRLNQSAHTLGAQGLGRSTSLLAEHQRIYEAGLDDAQSGFLAALASLLTVARPRVKADLTASVRSLFVDQLAVLANSFNTQLAEEASRMGLAQHAPSVNAKWHGLRTAAATAIGEVLAADGQARKPERWYQRPAGIIALSVIAGLIVAAILLL